MGAALRFRKRTLKSRHLAAALVCGSSIQGIRTSDREIASGGWFGMNAAPKADKPGLSKGLVRDDRERASSLGTPRL